MNSYVINSYLNTQKYEFIYKFIFEKTQYGFMYELIFLYKFIYEFLHLRLTLDAARDFGLGKSA